MNPTDESKSLRRQLAAALGEVADLRRQLARYAKGRRRRSTRTARRNLRLAGFIIHGGHSTATAADWRVLRDRFAQRWPELCLTAIPPGPIDALPVDWMKANTIDPRALRLSFRQSEFAMPEKDRRAWQQLCARLA